MAALNAAGRRVYVVYERGAVPYPLRVFGTRRSARAFIAARTWPRNWVCHARAIVPPSVEFPAGPWQLRVWEGGCGPFLISAATYADILAASEEWARMNGQDPRAYAGITYSPTVQREKEHPCNRPTSRRKSSRRRSRSRRRSS